MSNNDMFSFYMGIESEREVNIAKFDRQTKSIMHRKSIITLVVILSESRKSFIFGMNADLL